MVKKDPRWLIEHTSTFTPFQRKVYRAILDIPKGETRSYKWVAQKIGSPRAFRAVGQALHFNPYPVVIPCHRVIRSDGGMGGYALGISRKKELLRKEKQGKRCP